MMKVFTIRNVHGHHLGQATDSGVLETLRSYVEFAVRGQAQHTSLSSDMTMYPLWPDVLKLNLPEGSDGVLEVRAFAHRPLNMPDHELGAGEVSLSKVQSGQEVFVPLKHVHHHIKSHPGDISFVASFDDWDQSGTTRTEGGPVPATTGVSGAGASVTDVHGVKTGKAHPANAPGGQYKGGSTCEGIYAASHSGAGGPSEDTSEAGIIPATAGYSGGGATVSDDSGMKTGSAHPDNVSKGKGTSQGMHALGGAGGPCEHTMDHPEAVPATAGYSGGGATVTCDGGVPTGKAHPDNLRSSSMPNTAGSAGGSNIRPHSYNPAASAGAAAAVGGAGGAAEHTMSHQMQSTGPRPSQTESLVGAGGDTPVETMPVAGSAPPTQKPSAAEKARMKTAALAHGVQEDMMALRHKLAGTQVSGEGGATGTAMEPQHGQGEHTRKRDKIKQMAVKMLDKTQTALEGAKQKVTKHTTAPAPSANAAAPAREE